MACFLMACGGETAPVPVVDAPAVQAPTRESPAVGPAAPAPERSADPPASTSAASRLPNDLDDPTLAAYCAEKTNVPTRGSVRGDAYFWSDGAIDITGGVSDKAIDIHLRWPSTLTTEPNTGEPMRKERYSYMTIAFDGELVIGQPMATKFMHGGGGNDCTAHSNQGGDAAGGSGVASTLTVTNRTSTVIEGTLEVPTETGVQRLAFSAAIVPPAPTTSTKFVCCLAP